MENGKFVCAQCFILYSQVHVNVQFKLQEILFPWKLICIFFTSSTVEEQVSYGGEVVGESAMKRVEDIGNEVIHKYYVWAL